MAYDCSNSAVKTRYFMIYCEHVIQLVKGGNTQKVCFVNYSENLIMITYLNIL